jgi:hypothetical protein
MSFVMDFFREFIPVITIDELSDYKFESYEQGFADGQMWVDSELVDSEEI